MYSLSISLLSLIVLIPIAAGVAMEFNPALRDGLYVWRKPAYATQMLLFMGTIIVVGILGGQEAMAAVAASADTTALLQSHASSGFGLELVGIGIPTAGAAIGAGIAVGQIGAASLGVVAEKPEMFGRTLIFLGLGEGIAIYGLVMSILLLGKLTT